jgi:hypothetical protein
MAEVTVVRAPLSRMAAQRLRSVLALPDEKLRAINKWAKTHLRTFLQGEEDDLLEIEKELGISRSDFRDAMSLFSTALMNEETPGSVNIDTYVARLRESGLGDVAQKANLLLEGISIPSDEAIYIPQKSLAIRSVVPTLEDADVLCELRAVFRRLPSPSPSSVHQEHVKNLLGFEPLVLVSLHLNDSAGNDKACTFQVTEKSLRALLKTLNEASDQLEIVKQKQKMLSREGS